MRVYCISFENDDSGSGTTQEWVSSKAKAEAVRAEVIRDGVDRESVVITACEITLNRDGILEFLNAHAYVG